MPVRLAALVVCAVVLLSAVGCGKSNNEGKIVGKWRVVSSPELNADATKALELVGATPYMEFKADGTVIAGVDGPAELKAKMNASGTGPQTGTYKLLNGNGVSLTGIGETKSGQNKAGRVEVVIDGDTMTLTDGDGPMKLTRWK